MADDMPPAVDDDLQELIAELMEAGPEEEADDRECEEITATALSEATEYLEEEIVQALQKHAATAEAEIAESQAFSAVLLADANRAASPVVVVHKRPTPETEKEQDQEPPRQRRRTGDSAAQD
ncbi:Os03g0589400 [Oryza sativa Japonica Group]|uniref:Os03g0589400 protein n=1 Tax=Oryza sativa subsp. japonica TaxID=39947 RepID=C7J078_ORYSJ|nr:Os03g0589400 [Oryza sativa Japonica Group]|eukprot:NP_001173516.1 Os03g0589400 [Oryza sativa Japonica Group]